MPADHEWLNNTNHAQWHWYLYNIIQDREEDFEFSRGIAEYHAGFLEPEVVSKTRKKREEEEQKAKPEGDNFARTIKEMFGRDVNFESTGGADVNNISSVLDWVDSYDRAHKVIETPTTYNFGEWIDFDLEQR